MDPEIIRTIVFGLTVAIGVTGPAIAIGLAGNGALQGMARNPELWNKLRMEMILVIAFAEAMALFALVVAFIIKLKVL